MSNHRTCLVTGASGGIGGEIAKALSQQGYKVIIQGRNLDKLLGLQQKLSGESEIVLGDLNNPDDRQRVLTEAFKDGPVNLLVNAAGITHFSALVSIGVEKLGDLMQTNLLTPMMLTQEFIRFSEVGDDNKSPLALTEQQRITIVNVGSVFGFIGYPGFSSYCASKFGLRGFTESLAREYSDTRFRFAYFAPRATRTNINTQTVDDMNNELGNATDSAVDVAQAFLTFVHSTKREKVLGWPEKLFVRVNGLLPKVVDNAIKSKLPIIKRFMAAQLQS
ncbi:MAG: short-subunit dehydrogenase [Paraglaciecola sp.]|jgi:short-subunit dehydrogenase